MIITKGKELILYFYGSCTLSLKITNPFYIVESVLIQLSNDEYITRSDNIEIYN